MYLTAKNDTILADTSNHQIGAEEARWAHNPNVGRSKLPSDNFSYQL